jgi:hypothetical protein
MNARTKTALIDWVIISLVELAALLLFVNLGRE